MAIDKQRTAWYIVFSNMLNNKMFLTATEVANLLRLNILTIYEYLRAGKLQAVKFGRNYRIENSELNKFIKEHRVKAKNR